MRLLSTMLSAVVADHLRSRGHDGQAINGNQLHEARSDREVLAVARAEQRALVTNNLVDFRLLHHDAITPGGLGHFGLVFMAGNYRATTADIGRIVTALQAKLKRFPGRSISSWVSLKRHRTQVYAPPTVNGDTWP